MGFCGAAVVWQWPETGSSGHGPGLVLQDAAQSRGLQVPQEGSSSPFLYNADCGIRPWRARGVGLGWERLRGGGGVRRQILGGDRGTGWEGILAKIRRLS